jgi:hypothetical protein
MVSFVGNNQQPTALSLVTSQAEVFIIAVSETELTKEAPH